MVATEKVTVDLLTQKELTVDIPAACANLYKDVPGSESRFDVSLTPGSEELGKLMEVIGKKSPSKEVKQVAVWIVTDNVTRGTLDSRYVRRPLWQPFGGLPAASDDVVEAIGIVEEAGINIAEKGIVKERISLIKGLLSKKRDIVEYSAKLLGYKGEKNLDIWKIETLIFVLKDKDWFVRKAAAEALRNITGQDFGQDHDRWNSWWQENKEKFLKNKKVGF